MPTKTEKGTDFILRLSGIELPDDVKERIAAELRATLMRELAKTDTGGSTKKSLAEGGGALAGGAILFHPEWYGGKLIRSLTTLKVEVERFNKTRVVANDVAL
jgi:hypothetical protein